MKDILKDEIVKHITATKAAAAAREKDLNAKRQAFEKKASEVDTLVQSLAAEVAELDTVAAAHGVSFRVTTKPSVSAARGMPTQNPELRISIMALNDRGSASEKGFLTYTFDVNLGAYLLQTNPANPFPAKRPKDFALKTTDLNGDQVGNDIMDVLKRMPSLS